MPRRNKEPQLWEIFSPSTAHYSPERDGSLVQYLKPQLEGQCQRLFKGLEQLELLKNEGWLLPGTSYVRFMYNIGRGDAHYLITTDWKLEGMNGGMHSGDEGVFTMEQIFNENTPPFEIGNIFGPAYERYLDQGEAELRIEEVRKEQRGDIDDVTSQ